MIISINGSEYRGEIVYNAIRVIMNVIRNASHFLSVCFPIIWGLTIAAMIIAARATPKSDIELNSGIKYTSQLSKNANIKKNIN